MNQNSNELDPQSLQPFLDSAANAAQMGPRQFYTPPQLAAALASVLPDLRPTCLDPQAGDSHLLRAVNADHSFAIEIDSRAKPPRLTEELPEISGTDDPDEKRRPRLKPAHLLHGDCTAWEPLADEVGLKFHYIACNPPFSLKWHTGRFLHLKDHYGLMGDAIRHHLSTNPGGQDHIDSTLGTFLMANSRLNHYGEGFMVCNAATARRLIADPETKQFITPAAERIWLWLEIPAVGYENVATNFDTAVIYFAASHGSSSAQKPFHFLRASSSDPEAVRNLLDPVAQNRMIYRRGSCLDNGYHNASVEDIRDTWKAVEEEITRRNCGKQSDFNIWLGVNGRIQRNLTTFQKFSGKLPADAVNRLNSLQGKTPMSLVVQKATRTTLMDAVHSGIWTVCPDLLREIEIAMQKYEAARAPFFRPNPVQALGSIDEHSHIKFTGRNFPGLEPGHRYKIDTSIVNTTWRTEKPSISGSGKDRIQHSGNELVVTISTSEKGGDLHKFHYRRDKDLPDIENHDKPAMPTTYHHPITALVENFEIPIPNDVAGTNPGDFQKFRTLLQRVEDHINDPVIPLTRAL